jgi:hypothetical protein
MSIARATPANKKLNLDSLLSDPADKAIILEYLNFAIRTRFQCIALRDDQVKLFNINYFNDYLYNELLQKNLNFSIDMYRDDYRKAIKQIVKIICLEMQKMTYEDIQATLEESLVFASRRFSYKYLAKLYQQYSKEVSATLKAVNVSSTLINKIEKSWGSHIVPLMEDQTEYIRYGLVVLAVLILMIVHQVNKVDDTLVRLFPIVVGLSALLTIVSFKNDWFANIDHSNNNANESLENFIISTSTKKLINHARALNKLEQAQFVSDYYASIEPVSQPLQIIKDVADDGKPKPLKRWQAPSVDNAKTAVVPKSVTRLSIKVNDKNTYFDLGFNRFFRGNKEEVAALDGAVDGFDDKTFDVVEHNPTIHGTTSQEAGIKFTAENESDYPAKVKYKGAFGHLRLMLAARMARAQEKVILDINQELTVEIYSPRKIEPKRA